MAEDKINIFEYLDFRKYLNDYYTFKKSSAHQFSYKIFAEKAGFKDKSCVFSVLNGKRNLNPAGVLKISRCIDHNSAEAEYFEVLVNFNQANAIEEKRDFFEKLCKIKERGAKRVSKMQMLRRDKFEFYSNWYNVAIRSIIEMYHFKNDYKWLARMVKPAITPKRARKSVELLQKLGLIEKQKNGFFSVPDKVISTGKEVLGFAVQNFHAECADLAKRAILHTRGSQRNISGLTLGISESGYNQICEELQAFQTKVIAIAENDKRADTAYQFNFHFFPTSNSDKEKLAK